MKHWLVRWTSVAMFGVAAACASTQQAEPSTADADAAAGKLPVTRPKQQPFPVIIGGAPVRIDGDLSDWPAVPVGRVAKADGTHACNFRVFVDATRLYAAFEVTDVTPVVNTAGPGRNWQGDAVELFVGTHPERRDELKEGDVQLVISYNPQAPLVWNYFSHKPMPGAAVVVKDAPGGWRVEASFALAELGLEPPAPGAPVWIDFALDNADTIGRASQHPWHGNPDLYKTPKLWKRSSFAPQP
ncbi:MAG TPA: sugar-binding protein [Anaeromyxobacter sp.]|nr:sugar-binding protein [Anaeromyxobacter sp.]